MRRRKFITLVGGAATWPLAARAQQATKVARIGFLSLFSPSAAALWHRAFLQSLSDLGWVEGKTFDIEYRYAEGRSDRLPELIADLIRLKVDVIVASGTNDTLAAKNATREIPIVMAAAGEPVGTGIVESLAHPGGNITGLSQMNPELTGKRLELLKKIVPNLSLAAVLWNPENSISEITWNEIQLPARNLRVEVHSLVVRNRSDLDQALEDAVRRHVGALVIAPNPLIVTNLKHVAEFAEHNRLPSIFHLREFAAAGGLISYGVDRSDLFRRAAIYVDKILKGAKPANLPVEQPTKFELVINLKTGKSLGLPIPPDVLAIADEVIE
jgi:putative tryptophan/tyrosine transport system substrate-binding protein